MRTFRIAVIAGDGVGQEVIPAALKVLGRVSEKYGPKFEYSHYDWGAEYYFQHGHMMPPGALDLLARCDAILLGAVGNPAAPATLRAIGCFRPPRAGFAQSRNVAPASSSPVCQR